MDIRVNRINSINLDFYNKDNRKRNFTDNQNENFDMAADFELISLNNKEKNKQCLQEAAELISKIQSYENGNFEKACGIYLTKMSDTTQVHHNKGFLALIKLIRDFVTVAAANILRNFYNSISNLFNEDFLAYISSAVSDVGRFCCDLCETIFTTGNKRLKYSEVSCSWI